MGEFLTQPAVILAIVVLGGYLVYCAFSGAVFITIALCSTPIGFLIAVALWVFCLPAMLVASAVVGVILNIGAIYLWASERLAPMLRVR